MVQILFDRVENIVAKGENASNQHFLHFTQCFLPGFAKQWHCAVKGSSLSIISVLWQQLVHLSMSLSLSRIFPELFPSLWLCLHMIKSKQCLIMREDRILLERLYSDLRRILQSWISN